MQSANLYCESVTLLAEKPGNVSIAVGRVHLGEQPPPLPPSPSLRESAAPDLASKSCQNPDDRLEMDLPTLKTLGFFWCKGTASEEDLHRPEVLLVTREMAILWSQQHVVSRNW